MNAEKKQNENRLWDFLKEKLDLSEKNGGWKNNIHTGSFSFSIYRTGHLNCTQESKVNFASGEAWSSCPVDNSMFHFPYRMVT